MLAMDQQALILKTVSPTIPGKGTIYWNLQWDVPLRWISYFTPMGGGGEDSSASGGILLF